MHHDRGSHVVRVLARIARSRHQVQSTASDSVPSSLVVLCSWKALQYYSTNHIDAFTHRPDFVWNCLVHVTGLSRTRSGCIVTAASPPSSAFHSISPLPRSRICMPAPPLQKKISQAYSTMSPPKPYGMPSGIASNSRLKPLY